MKVLKKLNLLCLTKNTSKLYKMDFEGQIKWVKGLPLGFRNEFFRKLYTSKDTNYYVNGDIFDFKWIKFDKNGDVIWFKNFQNDNDNSVVLMNDDGLIKSTFNHNRANVIELSRFDKNGTNLWLQRYVQFKNIYIKTITKCPNGGYLVVGSYDTFELFA